MSPEEIIRLRDQYLEPEKYRRYVRRGRIHLALICLTCSVIILLLIYLMNYENL